MTTKRVRVAMVAFGALAGMSPVSLSTSAGLEVAQACADGTCCPEEGSDCIINGILTQNAFRAAKPGPCSNQH